MHRESERHAKLIAELQAQVQPAKEVLLADVSSIKFQYMDPTSKSFQDIWPPAQSA